MFEMPASVWSYSTQKQQKKCKSGSETTIHWCVQAASLHCNKVSGWKFSDVEERCCISADFAESCVEVSERLPEFRGTLCCCLMWSEVNSYSQLECNSAANQLAKACPESCWWRADLGQDIDWISGDAAWTAGQWWHSWFFRVPHKRPQKMSASKYLFSKVTVSLEACEAALKE